MPVVFKKKTNLYDLLVWQVKETGDELIKTAGLSESDQVLLNSYKSAIRRREFLAVRCALKSLLGDGCPEIIYTDNGKPHLKDNTYISISHSGDFIALITAQSNVGIDIEKMRFSIHKISGKFVSEKERESLLNDRLTEKLHLIWGAKEVLFKLYGKGNVDFKKDLYVEHFDLDNLQPLFATNKKDDLHQSFTIHRHNIEDFVLTWCCAGEINF